MIELIRITDSDNLHFGPLMDLYTGAFPPHERRDTEQLKHWITEKPDMYFNAIIDEGLLAGFFIYWDMGAFYYFEHLAVYPELRNRKIGRQLLQYTHTHLDKPQVLEVEPMADEWSERRINYYLRNGYEIVDKTYIQPSYTDKQSEGYPMWLMSKPSLNKEITDAYTALIKEIVYDAGK